MDIASRRALTCSRCVRRVHAHEVVRYFTPCTHNGDTISTQSLSNDPSIDSSTIADTLTGSRWTGRDYARTRRQRVVQQQLGENSLKFEEMPFQCFQEARKVLLEDRKEKLQQIQVQRERMARIQAQDVAPQDEAHRQTRLKSMRKRLEELKIHADINDPLVKKRFEDGNGDMSKPIYRFLAERRWREYERDIVEQRITQMSVIPDVLPRIDLSVSVQLGFKNKAVRPHRKMEHGEILPSRETEHAPMMTIQPFDRGSRLVTIAVVNPDVPDVSTDGFNSRCHFLAANVAISPTTTAVNLASIDNDSQVIQPWLPAYTQKGLPYQRMAVFVLEQPLREDADSDSHVNRSRQLDVQAIRDSAKYGIRDGFSLRALVSRYGLTPVGADLYRSVWDEGTSGVMHRAGIIGADIEFKRKKIDPLPYKRMASRRYR